MSIFGTRRGSPASGLHRMLEVVARGARLAAKASSGTAMAAVAGGARPGQPALGVRLSWRGRIPEAVRGTVRPASGPGCAPPIPGRARGSIGP